MNKGGKKDGKKEIIQTYNTQLIFARVIYLLSIDQIKIDNLFSYELAPFPTSLFQDTGEGRYLKSKSTLKKDLKVKYQSEIFTQISFLLTVVRCCMLLYTGPREGQSLI